MRALPMSDHNTDLTKKNQYGIYLVYAALAILAIAIGVFLYWAFQPIDIIEVKNSPVPVRTIREHPSADGVVILKIDYCKKASATGRVRISFYSSSREVFLPVVEDKEKPQCGLIEYPVLVPHEIPSEIYKIKFRIEYKINPLRTVIEEFDSKEFEIVDNKVQLPVQKG